MRPPTWLARNASRIARCAPGSSGHVITWPSSENRARDGEHERGAESAQHQDDAKSHGQALPRSLDMVPSAGGRRRELAGQRRYGKTGQDKAEHLQSTGAWFQIFAMCCEALISCTAVRTTSHCV